MPQFEQFPDDDHYWLIKWIDGFRLPHLGTSSASVSVLLQKIPEQFHGTFRSASAAESAAILGKRSDELVEGEQFCQPQPRVHAGSLPALSIGAVYHRKTLVGRLPSSSLTLSLSDVEESCVEVKLNEELEPPEKWTKGHYKVLNRFEFIGPSYQFPYSRCLLLRLGNYDVVIPRTVILKSFYMASTAMALALSNGPWEKTLDTLINLKPMESGLKTEVADNGDWHIILQTKITHEYARHLAILFFDEHARACANSLYAELLIERAKARDGAWHASAKIPFRPDGRPLKLQTSGYWLPRRGSVSKPIGRRKFLVTQILGSTVPSYIPTIKYELSNSGMRSGIKVTEVDKPGPYSGTRPTVEREDDELIIDSSLDAHAASVITVFPGDEMMWLDTQSLEKIEKDSSKTYQSQLAMKSAEVDTSHTSTGNTDFKNDSLSQARAEMLVREPDKRFDYLLDAFEKLQKHGVFDDFFIMEPEHLWQKVRRGNLVCWKFLDFKARITGARPRLGWVTVNAANTHSVVGPKRSRRCALVVGITRGRQRGYWIEIESKDSESGFLSPFIYDLTADPHAAIKQSLNVIAQHRGIGLRTVLLRNCVEHALGDVKCYRHAYASKTSSALNTNSLIRFFNTVWR